MIAARIRLLVIALVALASCSHTPGQVVNAGSVPAAPPPVNAADAEFIDGMIRHHAQAVVMAGWALTHNADPALRRFAERVLVAQQDEIDLMQSWQRERAQPVTDGTSSAAHAHHNGMLMPGMLTPDQLAQLDRARGRDFDRLFLRFMIQHHRGAITMVDKLLAAHGAAQDKVVYRLAADIYADQNVEIDRMESMLTALEPQ